MALYRVKLYNDWRFYKGGEIISVNKEVANSLIEHNIAEYEKVKKPEEKELTKKEIKGAPKDKMFKGAPISKQLSFDPKGSLGKAKGSDK